MAKFVFVYHGGASGSTPEEQDKIMAAWGKWFGQLGEALVDGGNPFGAPKVGQDQHPQQRLVLRAHSAPQGCGVFIYLLIVTSSQPNFP
jgi:hypothetical protein